MQKHSPQLSAPLPKLYCGHPDSLVVFFIFLVFKYALHGHAGPVQQVSREGDVTDPGD